MNATITQDTLDFDAIFREFQPRIRGFIRQRIRDLDTADDLTSECFTRAIDATRRGLGPRSKPSGWLFQIARNLCTDHYRKQGRIALADWEDLHGIPAGDMTPHECAESALGCECIWEAIGGLTGKQERVITLLTQGDYSGKDLARETGQAVAAAKQRLLRARVRLREVLTTNGVDL